jgi:hypothetical protein
VCNPGCGILDTGLLHRRKYLIPKFGQLGGRKVGWVGDADAIKAFAKELLPIYRIGCLE